MADHAIVIGIDSHTDATWQLTAAVRDALAFAHWVTEKDAGRATPETLTLLLSPNADVTIETELTYRAATREHIEDALYSYSSEEQKAGAEAGRLWFFYAGHGVAPQGGGVDEAPVLVPADLADFPKYLALRPIEMSTFLRKMQIAPPAEQIYFIDACRGIVKAEDVVTSTQHLHFDLKRLGDVAAAQSRQAVLYATTSGQLANEYKAHGLFGAALLRGLRGRGSSLEPDPATLGFILTFGALAAFTKHVIAQQSKEASTNNRILPTQEPATDLFRTDGGLPIARFAAEPGVDLRVFVEPSAARTVGSAWIRTYDRMTRTWDRALQVVPVLPEPVRWSLRSGMHRVEIEAPGYKPWLQVVNLLGDETIRAQLDVGIETPLLPDLAPGAQGTLVVETFDRYARIEVFDDNGMRVDAGWAGLRKDLPVGKYRLEVSLPTEPTVTEGVLVTKGETRVTPQPASALPTPIEQNLEAISARRGVSVPSEVFGMATTTRLGSVLTWAAWAARFPENGNGQKLRSIGVEPFLASTKSSYAQVVVADARATAGVPGLAIAFGPTGAEVPVPSVPVPALPKIAMQWHGAVPAGQHSLTIAFDGLQPKTFPVAVIPGWVAVVIVTREASGAIEIHRYLNPLVPQHGFSDDIRRIEHSWRALESRTPLFIGEADALLALPLDPLSLSVLGYRLAREDKLPMLAGRLSELERSGLADGRILAALARGTHDIPDGVPFLGEGYRLLEEWLVALAARDNKPPPTPVRPFTGGFWTTFDARGQRTEARAFSLDTAPPWAAPLRSIASATGRLEPGADGRAFSGTAFVVGDGVAAATTFSIEPTAAGFGVAFEPGAPPRPIESVIARSATEQIALLRVRQPLVSAPALRWTPPHVGQRIAVIGHPMADARIPPAQLAQFTSVPNGSKVVMPGVVVEVKPDRVTYECWTMSGVAGGPVVDLDSNEVVAIHHSGSYEDKRKLGHGTPLATLINDPMWEQAGIPTPKARREQVQLSIKHGQPPTRLSPRDYMRHRRPDEFSDSSEVIPILDRTQLEYHLSTISDQNEEFRFKNFARRIAEHEVCPNLHPHTGPTGGSDGETYPIAEGLMLAWFEGDPESANERWGFALSTEKDWRAKVESDVRKVVKTGHGYTKVYFVSSQYIRDKERSDVEDGLSRECGFDVKILDRSWLLDRVFRNHREAVATEELGLAPLMQPKRSKGPRDAIRESDLESIETRIDSSVAAKRFVPALVDDCLRAAELSAALDRPRTETDERFSRAQQMASRCGTKHQQLYVEYQWAWRTYFWFEDASATIPLYLRVETLALGTNNVFELELLQNLWNVLRVGCEEQNIPTAVWDHEAHARILKSECERLAQDENRPSTRLQAREQLLLLRLMMEGPKSLDEVAAGLVSIVKEATNLIGFPMQNLAQIVTEFGESAVDSRPFEDLIVLVAETVAQREGDSASAKLLLKRAAQQMRLGRVYEAIKTAGLTLAKLYKFETRQLMLRALWLIGDAYERIGLPWAARGTYLFAASIAANEFWRKNDVTEEQAVCYKRLKWLELQLGRIPQALSWHEIERIVSALLESQGVSGSILDEDERSFDAALGILFLKADLSTLRECENMYDALEAVGLVMAPMALVHALGHSNADIEYWISLNDAGRTADDLFLLLRDQPASDDLPESIVYDKQVVELHSVVLGCRIRVTAPHDTACIEVAESFVACFEAFLATAMLARITPHRSTLTVHVERKSGLKTVEVAKEDSSHAWRISLAPSVPPFDTSQAHQLEIKTALTRVIVESFAWTFWVGEIEETMKQLGEDKALDRAINFANGFSCISNTLGNEPKFHLRDWSGPASYSCVREERWDARLPQKIKTADDKASVDTEALASSRFDLNRVKHSDMLASSVLDLALWDEAQWTGALYIVPHDKQGVPGGEPGIAVPGLALLFRNRSAGVRIFEQWISEFGHADTKETIRISILRGIRRKQQHHYRMVVSSDPTRDIASGGLRLFSVAARMHTMEPDTSTNLDGFLRSFRQAKEFVLLPGFMSGPRSAPDFSDEHYLRKRELVVRNAWEVGVHDPDRIAIHSTDDPIIPPDQSDPPIRALLTELHDRQRASAVAKRPTLPPQSKNSLCKCGSGKKYKKCCGVPASRK